MEMIVEIKYTGGDDIEVKGTKDAWTDLGLVMEALAMLAAANIGENPHNINSPQEMNDYIKSYIDKIKYDFVSNLAPTNKL